MKSEKILVGENLRNLRVKKDLSQTEFSKKIGHAQVKVSLIESNQRSITLPILISISDYLNLSLDETFNLLTKKNKGKKK
jgi:transcriptional regulator with XRE-family HTH domain